jgi:hypothetical protein
LRFSFSLAGGTHVIEGSVRYSSESLLGDYNGNGVVDAADYTVWRDTLGQTGTGLAADGNGNNQIDAGDYTVWQTHFGQSAGIGSSANVKAAVPEPATAVMLLIFVTAGWYLRSGQSVQKVPATHWAC